jgi:transcriptional regulator with XRE-family HTH domain
MTDKPFPEAVRELMEEQEISQRELVRRTRKKAKWGSISTINFLANGEFSPSVKAMEAISSGLGIRPEYFAEYRLAKAREALDPNVVGFRSALRALGE